MDLPSPLECFLDSSLAQSTSSWAKVRVTYREWAPMIPQKLNGWEWAVVTILMIWFLFHWSVCHFILLSNLDSKVIVDTKNGTSKTIVEISREQLEDFLSKKYNLDKVLDFEICVNNNNRVLFFGDEINPLSFEAFNTLSPHEWGAVEMITRRVGEDNTESRYVQIDRRGCIPTIRPRDYEAKFVFNDPTALVTYPESLNKDYLTLIKNRSYASACLTPQSSFRILIPIGIVYLGSKLLK